MRPWPEAYAVTKIETRWVRRYVHGFIGEAEKPDAWVLNNPNRWVAVVHAVCSEITLLNEDGDALVRSWINPSCYLKTKEAAELALLKWALRTSNEFISKW